MAVDVKYLHPRANSSHVGDIPLWLSEADPRRASEQLNGWYGHGGGWNPFRGFELREDNSIKYPGDPAHPPIAEMRLRDELILVYESAWVAVIQKDRSFEICRMD